MTHDQAVLVVEQLFAAFPDRHRTEDTRAVYVRYIAKLRSFGQAMSVVEGLTESEKWLPPIAAVYEAYRVWGRAHPMPAIPEPDLTEQERAANVRRARALTEMVSGDIDFPTALSAVEAEDEI